MRGGEALYNPFNFLPLTSYFSFSLLPLYLILSFSPSHIHYLVLSCAVHGQSVIPLRKYRLTTIKRHCLFIYPTFFI